MGTVRKDDWKDEDGDANDDALLSSAFLSSAFVPEVRFVIATIVVAIIVVTVCHGMLEMLIVRSMCSYQFSNS